MKKNLETLVILGLPLIFAFGIFAPISKLNTYQEIPPPLESPVVSEPLFIAETKTGPEVLSFPVELSIGSLRIKAPIQSVGILDGAMAVPNSPESVGWYQYGTRPGEVGSAVLAGHVNWRGGKTAVFGRLKEIQIGALISVTDNFGKKTFFIVRDIQNYPIDTETSEIFFSHDSLSHLNLITCYGEWDNERRTHKSRLVVFADKL